MVAAVLALLAAQESYAPDAEGFIRNWLILAPIPCDSESNGAVEINAQPVPQEARLAPKAGDTATAGGRTLTWAAHKTAEHFIDFRHSFAKDRFENMVGYAVAYVHAEADLDGLRLKAGSNDQCKAYLNGIQVLVCEEGRTLEKDASSANVALKKGRNVVIFKVLNETNNWQGCLRFTGQDGAPVRNLKVTLE